MFMRMYKVQMYGESSEYKQSILTIYLLVLSADNFCKQFGPRSGLTKCRAWSGSKLFDPLMVFLKEFFENIDF